MASEKTVTTVTEEKTNKYEISSGRGSYIREQTSASRDPLASLYCYLEKSESLNIPDELQVPNRVVDEEGKNEEEDAEEQSEDAAHRSIFIGVKETEVSEFADEHEDIHTPSIIEGNEVEVEG